MKKKTIILSLVTVLLLGIGTTTYAATSNSETGNNSRKNISSGYGLGKMANFKGHDILTNLLKENGVTDEEINSALDSKESLHDLAVEKGLTDEQIKEYMVNEKIKSIDEAVANGNMTAEQGEEIKTRIQENSANCTTPGQGNRAIKGSMNMKHNGQGKMINFKGRDILTNLLKENGATDEEINSALDSKESLHDLAVEKGLTDEQIKEYMVSERIKSIDEAVANGSMTSEQGEEIKTRIQENSANCTTPGQGNRKMNGSMNMKHAGQKGMRNQQNNQK